MKRLTFAVLQDAAFAANAFGHQNAANARRPDHAGRMELDKFHVDQLGSGVVRKCVAVARAFPAVARDLVRTADAAGRENDSLCLEDAKTSVFAFVGETADDAVAVFEQRHDRDLHIDLDALMDAVVLKRADQFETGAVADVSETWITMAAEISLEYLAVFCPVENGSPGLEFANAVRGLFGVELGHSPVVDVLAAAHRVGKMDLPIVAVIDICHRRRHPALGHDGVSLAKQRLADQPDRNARRGCLDSGPRSGAAGTDDEHVVFKCWISQSVSLKEPKVVPYTHRAQPHVNVRKPDHEQADPGKQHMSLVQGADAAVSLLTDRFIGQNVINAADQMPKAVAAECIKPQANDIRR